MEISGYSQTPLAKKLGIKEGFSVLLVNRPEYYFELFSDMPAIKLEKSASNGQLDFIHLFVKTKEEMEDRVIHLKPLLKKNGIVWVSWPKGSSKVVTDLNRDFIREFVLSIGLVDVKVCAVDNIWSGLKFVYRVKDR